MQPTQVDGEWQCRVTAPGWPELADGAIRLESGEPPEPAAEQLEAVRQLVAGATQVRVQIARALAANAEAYVVNELGADESAAAEFAEGLTYAGKLQGVMVWRERAGVTWIGFDFESILDENEHGVGVVWAGGRVHEVGSAEVCYP